MAGGATQRLKINALFLEQGVSTDIAAMAASTGFGLTFSGADLVEFGVHGVTGRAINIAPVVWTTQKHDLLFLQAFIRMAMQAGLQLLLAW